MFICTNTESITGQECSSSPPYSFYSFLGRPIARYLFNTPFLPHLDVHVDGNFPTQFCELQSNLYINILVCFQALRIESTYLWKCDFQLGVRYQTPGTLLLLWRQILAKTKLASPLGDCGCFHSLPLHYFKASDALYHFMSRYSYHTILNFCTFFFPVTFTLFLLAFYIFEQTKYCEQLTLLCVSTSSNSILCQLRVCRQSNDTNCNNGKLFHVLFSISECHSLHFTPLSQV